MKTISLKMLIVIAALTATGAVTASDTADEETLKAIAGYRQWTRVTERALPVVDSSLAG